MNRFSGHITAFRFSDIIGESQPIRESVRLAMLAAPGDANVLLQGESGTGKDLFAQAIHHGSARRGGPYIALNCGAIPRELVGSELFGYEGGAFTGARREGRPGKFELAAGGTLFLDEIGDMPLEQQAALLRVIEEKTVTRIGGHRVIPTDVRLICASNKNLIQAVAQGIFRQDLYYRLNVISITVPTLRERGEDILLLFRHFLERLAKKQGVSYTIDPAVPEFLMHYDWPGNVRELHNMAERAVNLAEDRVISLRHFPVEPKMPTNGGQLAATGLEKAGLAGCRERARRQEEGVERARIMELLRECSGNISLVAKRLQVARSTVYRKIRYYDDPPSSGN